MASRKLRRTLLLQLHWRYLVSAMTCSKNLSALRDLFVLSQTESLMLDRGDFEEVLRIAERKGEIIETLSTAESEDSAPALELISRINAIDAKNRERLERLRRDSLSGLQQIRDQRHLTTAYSLNRG